jgi:hypothetical protein
MKTAIGQNNKQGNGSGARILYLALGAALIGVSVWGIAPCREMFRNSIGTESLPGDASFVSLAAWMAWTLFFGPLAFAGMAMVWSTLRKMAALDRFAFWLWNRAGQPSVALTNTNQCPGIATESVPNSSHGVESLSPQTAERLQRTAARAAIILGAVAGTLLLGIGMFGLAGLLFFSRPYNGSSVYAAMATGRLTITFAVLSGMLVLAGISILRNTFRRENDSWLLPLRAFVYTIVRRKQAVEGAGRTSQHLLDAKRHPKV